MYSRLLSEYLPSQLDSCEFRYCVTPFGPYVEGTIWISIDGDAYCISFGDFCNWAVTDSDNEEQSSDLISDTLWKIIYEVPERCIEYCKNIDLAQIVLLFWYDEEAIINSLPKDILYKILHYVSGLKYYKPIVYDMKALEWGLFN